MVIARNARRWLVATLILPVAVAGCSSCILAADLNNFKSDGCSLFPDGNYYSCCYLHDVAYWPGGTEKEKQRADEALSACVQEMTGDKVLARKMFEGVRVGGVPGLPTTFRWGYGWPFPYRKDYAPLTPAEQKQLSEKKQKLCKTIRLNPATGGYVVDVDREISALQARQICPNL